MKQMQVHVYQLWVTGLSGNDMSVQILSNIVFDIVVPSFVNLLNDRVCHLVGGCISTQIGSNGATINHRIYTLADLIRKVGAIKRMG